MPGSAGAAWTSMLVGKPARKPNPIAPAIRLLFKGASLKSHSGQYRGCEYTGKDGQGSLQRCTDDESDALLGSMKLRIEGGMFRGGKHIATACAVSVLAC